VAKFSIILPVWNGGEYVKECVASILAQSFTDFDCIILDNQSTDGTVEWIRSLNDPRIRVYLSGKPLGIEENWGRIVTVPKNEFITLIGHDDILNRDYLSTMNALLQKFPDASLYQTHFTYIDAAGEKIRDCKEMAEKELAGEFLSKFLQKRIDVMGTGFMMRAKDYDAIGGIPAYPNLLFADFELWIRLTGKSYKATSPEKCFSFRIHQSTTTVSPDIKFHKAFERFIYFLDRISKEDTRFKKVVHEDTGGFLRFYCKALSHRLLRTPKKAREGLSVKQFVDQCRNYAALLEADNPFNPGFSTKLAIWIDSNGLTRSMFLAFKKLFPRPVLK
jgi:glycosyltransferase involved in cell wall biosynthesis